MNYRTLDLTLISAKGIKKPSLTGKPDVYAVAYISGTTTITKQKLKTHVDKDGGSNPTWNFPMKFTVDEAAGLQNRLTLVVEIKAVGTFSDKNLGEVRVPVKELLQGSSTQQLVSYQVRKHSGKPNGFLSFSYKLGEKFSGKAEEPVMAYPPGMAVGSSAAYAPPYEAAGRYYQQAPAATGYPGYAYQHQQQPGYGGYPPPPPPGYGGYPPQQGYGYPAAVQQPPKKNKLGMGLGAGLLGGALGGLLIGDIVSDAGGGCGGGGCGGGGCGGF
ncbi:unnamed protein product [Lactuca saligna]|uniref:C2 domain-containing protein n=1 Tax=Lactuca saligna TaxID=75948 RepID=A0AA35YB60_LACSI|nr:unnamed protein product [Lactuca saligna]